jgi:hypothetical protein
MKHFALCTYEKLEGISQILKCCQRNNFSSKRFYAIGG